MNKVKYHIIGPRGHWEIKRTAVIQTGVSITVIYLALFILTVYQFLIHENITAALHNTHETENSFTQKLEENSAQLQQQISRLQKELQETSDSLTTLQTTQHSNSQTQLGIREKIFEYQLEINDLNFMVKNSDIQVKTLENQQQEYLQDTQSLSRQLQDLEKQLNKVSSAAGDFSGNENKSFFIAQTQIKSDKNSFAVRFNLRSTHKEAQSGFVSILPLTAERLNQEIEFDSKTALPFSIKHFLPFSKRLEKPKQSSFTAIRIIIWDKNNKIVFNQNFHIP